MTALCKSLQRKISQETLDAAAKAFKHQFSNAAHRVNKGALQWPLSDVINASIQCDSDTDGNQHKSTIPVAAYRLSL